MMLREASVEDIEGIRTVARASWERDYPDILSRETVDDGIEEWYAADSLHDALGDSRTRLFVADESDRVVGFAHAALGEESVGYILRLYVHPEHRGEGIGRQLVERVRADLFDHGADQIRAMVLADNDPGNAFYSTLGFEQTGEAATTIGGESFKEHTFVLHRE